MPFIYFYSSLLHLPKKCRCNPNRNQTEINDCRAGSAHLLRTTNCLNCMAEEYVAYIYICYRLMWNKELGVFQSCIGYLLQADTWETEPTKPRWTPLSCWAPVFCKRQQAFAPHNNTLHSQPIPPLPNAEVLSSRDSDSSFQNSSVLDYSHPAQVTSGCQQATTADTDGSPGLWWLPYVMLVLQVCAF